MIMKISLLWTEMWTIEKLSRCPHRTFGMSCKYNETADIIANACDIKIIKLHYFTLRKIKCKLHLDQVLMVAATT